MEKTVFVTVGTTSFDSLIRVLDSPQIHSAFRRLGYKSLVMQIGRGSFEPKAYVEKDFRVDFYRYKDSLNADLTSADLVISHAGAGSCMETLAANKPLIVVINEELMHNHQIELAHQLAEDGHAISTDCNQLPVLLEDADNLVKQLDNLAPFPRGKPECFASFLDSIMKK